MSTLGASKQASVTQVTVASAASTAIAAANPLRKRIGLLNIGATNFAWIDPAGGTASATNGFKLLLDASNNIVWLETKSAITGRADTANVTVCVVEEFD